MQLINKQIHHYKATDLEESGIQPLTGDPNESAELRPFPTLVEAFKGINAHTGFNIELKYPMKMKVGSQQRSHLDCKALMMIIISGWDARVRELFRAEPLC